MERMTFSIPEKLKESLERESELSGRSQAEIVRAGVWNQVEGE